MNLNLNLCRVILIQNVTSFLGLVRLQFLLGSKFLLGPEHLPLPVIWIRGYFPYEANFAPKEQIIKNLYISVEIRKNNLKWRDSVWINAHGTLHWRELISWNAYLRPEVTVCFYNTLPKVLLIIRRPYMNCGLTSNEFIPGFIFTFVVCSTVLEIRTALVITSHTGRLNPVMRRSGADVKISALHLQAWLH